MSALFDSVIVLSTVETITIFLNNTVSAITDLFQSVITEEPAKTYSEGLLIFYKNLSDYLYFDDFQFKLLKGFLVFLLINIVLICASWRVCGKRICERFMKPATSKAIEELRASVSKLKLPKEHSPRI